jgi:hypothetical protein
MEDKKFTMEEEYQYVLKSGLFWEFFPTFTGNYNEDKDEFEKFYKDRENNLNKIKLK